jgi:hypothetical protein
MTRTAEHSGLRKFLILWPLFFMICAGLGYPSLRRFDPRVTEGLSDTIKYYAMTTGADTSGFKDLFRCRVLVPFVARPFYWFALYHIPTWNPVFFGLLVSASIFCATTGCLIVSTGDRLFGEDVNVGLTGALLYLLNFGVSNLQLAGLVDAGEACFMAALIWSLLNKKWWLLPLWGLFGAAAKETFVLFSSLLALIWWSIEWRRNHAGLADFKWVVALALVGLAVVTAIHASVSGHFQWPWQIAQQARAGVNVFTAFLKIFTERSFWYVFGWLLPLGLIRMRSFPKPWVVSATAVTCLGLAFATYNNSGGTVGRASFNIIGPLLSLSVASLLARKSPIVSAP